jgi:hypothetical protein
MAAINRAALAEHLWPGIIEFFGAEYADYEEQCGYMFDKRNSSKAFEEYVMESMFGLAPVKEAGAAITFDEAADAWKGRVDMVAYALGFVITREAVDDDQYFDLVPRYTKALKRSMKITKEVRAAAFMDATFSTSITGDGVSVVNAAHPLKNAPGVGTLSNRAAANADLNETSLEAAQIQIADWTDERGLRISVQPTRLIIPNGLQYTATRLMNTTGGRPGTGDNDIATVPGMNLDMKLNNYLSDPRAWWLKTNVGEGMTMWERTPLDIEQGDGSETQVMKVMAYERYAFSCMDWRSIWGSPGA